MQSSSEVGRKCYGKKLTNIIKHGEILAANGRSLLSLGRIKSAALKTDSNIYN
ncbi:MAG: hypothetical protein KME40_20685 [Komarekiella atlantica HA4396-MV6]|nr:hypothetical protein [Komarekiella atlantica HA4396-MV6]